MVKRLSPQSPGRTALMTFSIFVYCFIVFSCRPGPTQYISYSYGTDFAESAIKHRSTNQPSSGLCCVEPTHSRPVGIR